MSPLSFEQALSPPPPPPAPRTWSPAWLSQPGSQKTQHTWESFQDKTPTLQVAPQTTPDYSLISQVSLFPSRTTHLLNNMLGEIFFLSSKNNLGIEETESIVPSASLVSRSSLAVPLCTCSPENCSHRSRRGSYSRHSWQQYLQQWELDLVRCPSAGNGQIHMVKAYYGYCAMYVIYCCITN